MGLHNVGVVVLAEDPRDYVASTAPVTLRVQSAEQQKELFRYADKRVERLLSELSGHGVGVLFSCAALHEATIHSSLAHQVLPIQAISKEEAQAICQLTGTILLQNLPSSSSSSSDCSNSGGCGCK
eukprot:TRINITY_DN10302_c0_g1_i13.p1 TRINITY_DN10302_c0_g1~~TRINITY_DN10302_c0_g1_i13.p1  ORF type:complete len:136 (+),score=47.67 TRINITY_DN10302_c0_g1_i13:33-410(+)